MRALLRIHEYLLCIVYKYYIPYLVIEFTTACPGVRTKSNFARVRIGKGGGRAKSLGTKKHKIKCASFCPLGISIIIMLKFPDCTNGEVGEIAVHVCTCGRERNNHLYKNVLSATFWRGVGFVDSA